MAAHEKLQLPDKRIDIFTTCCNFATDPSCLLAAVDA
jgi:hypothetical protein